MATTVYKGHNIANIALPAVTIGAENDTQVPFDVATVQNDTLANHEILLSIRVHTAYGNAPYVQTTTVAVVDAIVAKLKSNLIMGEYRLMNFEATDFRQEFEESNTKGATVLALLHTAKQYTQE